jgi:hypothetical protein
MRGAASLLTVLAASLCVVQAANAQSADKAQQPTAATGKTQVTPKAAAAQSAARPGTSAPNARGAGDSGKAKLEGVSTMPASDNKKDGDCHHGLASDA